MIIYSALPYSNYYLHLGNIAGSLLPADIHHRLNKGSKYITGSDQFGEPIISRAIKENKTPKKISEFYHFKNKKIMNQLQIQPTRFLKTNQSQHKKMAKKIFQILLDNNKIKLKKEKLDYCKLCKKYCFDRLILLKRIGKQEIKYCLKCDSELITTEEENYFLDLSDKTIINLINNTELELKDQKKIEEFKKIQEKSITRQISWGIKINSKHRLYVWFEALLSYISFSSPKWFSEKKFFYFGKDNLFFHALMMKYLFILIERLDPFFKGISQNIVLRKYNHLLINSNKISKRKLKPEDPEHINNLLKKYTGDELRFLLIMCSPENKDRSLELPTIEKTIKILNNQILNLFHRVISASKKKDLTKIDIGVNQITSHKKYESKNQFFYSFNELLKNIKKINQEFQNISGWETKEKIIPFVQKIVHLKDELKPYLPKISLFYEQILRKKNNKININYQKFKSYFANIAQR